MKKLLFILLVLTFPCYANSNDKGQTDCPANFVQQCIEWQLYSLKKQQLEIEICKSQSNAYVKDCLLKIKEKDNENT